MSRLPGSATAVQTRRSWSQPVTRSWASRATANWHSPSATSAALLTGAATVLLVSLLRALHRRRAMASQGTRAGTTG